jgi:hypothetical protein
MKRLLLIVALACAVVAAAGSARALTVVGPGFAVSVPLYATVAPPPPVYVAPAYVPPPPPVYVAPAYVPPPVWVGPPVIAPRPMVVGPVGPGPYGPRRW